MSKRIVICSKEGREVEKHLGHCNEYLLYVIDGKEVIEKRKLSEPEKVHGGVLKLMLEEKIDVVITCNLSSGVYNSLKERGIEVIIGVTGENEQVLNKYIAGELTSGSEEDFVHTYIFHEHPTK